MQGHFEVQNSINPYFLVIPFYMIDGFLKRCPMSTLVTLFRSFTTFFHLENISGIINVIELESLPNKIIRTYTTLQAAKGISTIILIIQRIIS